MPANYIVPGSENYSAWPRDHYISPFVLNFAWVSYCTIQLDIPSITSRTMSLVIFSLPMYSEKIFHVLVTSVFGKIEQTLCFVLEDLRSITHPTVIFDA